MKPLFNIYVISDNHFNHWAINKHCNRKFRSLEEMNGTMVKKWNNAIRPQDLVIHLGDIIFTKGTSKDVKLAIKNLNGRKILVHGNHDRMSYHFYLSNGIDFICEKFSWYYNNKKILFIHDPKKITITDIRKHDFIIHGHVHNKFKMIRRKGKCTLINVSVEKTNYLPLNLQSLLNKQEVRNA